MKGSESLTHADATPSEYLSSSMVVLPETCQSKSHFHISIILKGRNWSCCTAAMVDSGATALFIGEAFAKCHKMFLEPLVKPIKLLNIDGTLNKAGSIHYKMRLILCTRTKEKKFEFLVTNCGPETIVLGLLWLRIMNPDIDWAKGELHIWDCYNIALSIYWRSSSFSNYSFSFPLYDIHDLRSHGMTLGISCDLSIPWPIGLVHLPDRSYLVRYYSLTRMAQPPVGLQHFLVSSMSFYSFYSSLSSPFHFILSWLMTSSILFYSLLFYSFPFHLFPCFAHDLIGLYVYKPLYK